jgi:hypothetical protein
MSFFLQLHRAYWYYQELFYFYPTDAQIKCSKKNVEIYAKIYIKSTATCFDPKNHHQGAQYCASLKLLSLRQSVKLRLFNILLEYLICATIG